MLPSCYAAPVLLLLGLQEPSSAQSGKDLLARGKEHFLAGEYEEAVRALRGAVPLLPARNERLDARLTLALIHQAQANDERTLIELQWALVEEPDLALDENLYSPKTRELLERARRGAFDRLLSAKKDFNAGNLELALEEFRLASALLQRGGNDGGENVLDALLSSALILQTLGDDEGSRRTFYRALELRPELELDTNFYSPSTVRLFRDVKEEGPRLLGRVRSALGASKPKEALEILSTAGDAFYAPAERLESRALESYGLFLLGDRERAHEMLSGVINEEPGIGLDKAFYRVEFVDLAENLRIVATRGLPRIAIVQSSDSIVHDASRAGFEDATLARYDRFVLERDLERLESAGSDFDLIYALGEEALARAAACCSRVPLIAGNLPAAATIPTAASPRGGVLWNVSTAAQIPVALRALPTVRRVGAVSGPDQGLLLAKELGEGLASHGIELVTREVRSQDDIARALDELVKEIELYWYLPDPMLASREAFDAIRGRCDREGKPIFAFHESLVKAGAFLGVSADFTSLGRQAGHMAVTFLSSRDPSALQVVPADASRVVINLSAAERLRIEPDPNLVSLAAMVYR